MNDWTLRIVEPDQPPRELPIRAGFTLGRAPANDVVLADPKVSGRHARFVEFGGRLCVEDLGSANRTVVASGPTLGKGEKHPLADGIVLQVGRTTLEVRAPAAPAVAKTELLAMPTLSPSAAPAPSPSSAGLGDTTIKGGPTTGGVADTAFLRAARPRLVVANEALKASVAMTKSPFVVGRKGGGDDAADCVVAHDGVSGHHARITFQSRRFFVADLGSKNFTYLGKEMLPPESPRELAPNAHLRFGPVDVLFVCDVDAEGRAVDGKRARTALALLESEGTLTRLQRERVEAAAKERKLDLGEALLLEGLAPAERWVDALDRARLVEAVADPGLRAAVGGGGRGALIAFLIALVVVLGAIAVPAVRLWLGQLIG